MSMCSLYDTIGINYANLRKPDPRIARQIADALGNAETVLNVGAGAGSYEPQDRMVTAIEPSAQMISQRTASNATVIQGKAEALPFDDDTFDAAMAVLTIHHWTDKQKGVAEIRRVARGKVVILTFDPWYEWFWLADYFPGLVPLDKGQMPRMTDFASWLDRTTVSPLLIPHDCCDGFLAAYWRRPAAYLDERVRAAMSPFWVLGDISGQLAALEDDLKNGTWIKSYGHLLALDELDCGYRLIESP